MEGLVQALLDHAQTAMPKAGQAALNQRQRSLLKLAVDGLRAKAPNLLILGENLRISRSAFDRLLGRTWSPRRLAAWQSLLDHSLLGRAGRARAYRQWRRALAETGQL